MQVGMIDCCAGRDDRLVIYNKIRQTIVIWMYVMCNNCNNSNCDSNNNIGRGERCVVGM